MNKSSISFLAFLCLWFLLLLLLFPSGWIGLFFSVFIFFLTVGVGFWAINRYKSKPKRILVSFMCMLLSAYGITALYPAQHTKPLSEIRAATGATFQYASLSPLLLYKLPEPPYALNTAILHRNQSESADFAAQFSFDYDRENYFLITIVNSNIGTSYEGLIDAELKDKVISLTLAKNDQIDTFRLPLAATYEPQKLQGLNGNFSITAHPLYTEIHPNQPFQKAFWKFLDIVYPKP